MRNNTQYEYWARTQNQYKGELGNETFQQALGMDNVLGTVYAERKSSISSPTRFLLVMEQPGTRQGHELSSLSLHETGPCLSSDLLSNRAGEGS